MSAALVTGNSIVAFSVLAFCAFCSRSGETERSLALAPSCRRVGRGLSGHRKGKVWELKLEPSNLRSWLGSGKVHGPPLPILTPRRCSRIERTRSRSSLTTMPATSPSVMAPEPKKPCLPQGASKLLHDIEQTTNSCHHNQEWPHLCVYDHSKSANSSLALANLQDTRMWLDPKRLRKCDAPPSN